MSPIRFSRRSLLAALGLAAVSPFVPLSLSSRRPTSADAADLPRHLSWVWQFDIDGSPDVIGSRLADLGMGILLKTHDGTDWMAKFDTSPLAVTDQSEASALAAFFENEGVPFHAWTVLKGAQPLDEARMAAQVLEVGAHSLYLSAQAREGFWSGTPDDAKAFGDELRSLQPGANLVLACEIRPWLLKDLPLEQFAAFVNAFAPFHFWDAYDTQEDRDQFTAAGFPPPDEGITPEFLADVTDAVLGGYGLPILPVGESTLASDPLFGRFLDTAKRWGPGQVSVWRFGETSDDVFGLLGNRPPVRRTHVVEAGDTVGSLAEIYGVSAEDIIKANHLTNPDMIVVGQELGIP
jgi:nucleoid-associated protein YgaU